VEYLTKVPRTFLDQVGAVQLACGLKIRQGSTPDCGTTSRLDLGPTKPSSDRFGKMFIQGQSSRTVMLRSTMNSSLFLRSTLL